MGAAAQNRQHSGVYSGDRVEYKSTCSERVWRGVVEGFFGENLDSAMCTDQTGRKSRPVAVDRLKKVA